MTVTYFVVAEKDKAALAPDALLKQSVSYYFIIYCIVTDVFVELVAYTIVEWLVCDASQDIVFQAAVKLFAFADNQDRDGRADEYVFFSSFTRIYISEIVDAF